MYNQMSTFLRNWHEVAEEEQKEENWMQKHTKESATSVLLSQSLPYDYWSSPQSKHYNGTSWDATSSNSINYIM
jgi:hypothetical protein